MSSRAEKLFDTPVADVYVHYANKIVRKGQDVENLDLVITWLTGFDSVEIREHLDAKTTFSEFFGRAKLNPNAELITGSICGVKIQKIENPLMKKIRYLDKLIDELAKGKVMEKILRQS